MTQNPTQTKPRLWEIDAVRGLAVLAMIFFHFMWDLWFYRLTDQNIVGGAWQTFARGIGTTFIFVLGLSVTLDVNRMIAKGISPFQRTLRRAALVFGCGLLVSIGTYFFVPNEWVRFGILHHAGVAIFLCFFFVRLPAPLVLLIGLVLIATGYAISGMPASTELLIPFGLVPPGTGMVDYYPLLPWFGVALLGVAAGNTVYKNGQRTFALPDFGGVAPVRFLRWLGQHSLVIYILHQLILQAVLIGLLQVGVLRPLF